ncbi:MAG: LamG domain-containing protein [Gammaproteobacteria bacterium]
MHFILFLPVLLFLSTAQASNPVRLLSLPAISDDTVGESAPRATPVESMQLDFVIAPGSYEPASMMLEAINDVDDLQLAVSEFRNSEGELQAGISLDIRVVKRWYQKRFGGYSPKRLKIKMSELLVHDDTLVRVSDGRNELKLSDGSYIDISKGGGLRKPVSPKPSEMPVKDAPELLPLSLVAGDRRQFWMTLYVDPETPAGIYLAELSVHKDEVFHALPVRIEVLPFTLAEPALEYSIYYRGKLDEQFPQGSVSSEFKSKAQMLADLENMRDHGITNPTIYQKLKTGMLSEVLEIREQAGFKTDKLYFHGVNIVSNDSGDISPRLSANVSSVVEEAKKFAATEVYFYARDEARGEELVYQLPFWEAVQNAGGKIMAAGWRDTNKAPGNFSVLGGAEDLYIALGTLDPEEARKWHGKGKLIYSYHNPAGGYELPATWRRNYGLLLWQSGYDGAMPYPWQHSYGNAWNDFDHYRHKDLVFAYPAVDKPIDTLQWEAFREGVDDVRYLTTLLEMLQADEYKDSEYHAAAEEWVEQLRAIPLGQADLDLIRAEIIGYILALMGWQDEAATLPIVTDLQLMPVEPDESAMLSWKTSQRTDSSVTAGRRNYQAVPRVYEHVVRLDGIRQGRSVEVEIQTQHPGQEESLSNSIVLTSEKGISYQDVSLIAGDESGLNRQVLSVLPVSDYRSSTAVVSDGDLLGWWRFSSRDDEFDDASGGSGKAELKGDAKSASGWFGRGVSLPGNGSLVYFPDIEIPENGTATIEGWYRFRSFAMDEVQNTGLFTGLYQHGDSNHLYFSRTNDFFETGSLLSRNTWHHIVISWDGDVSTAMCFIDGNKVNVTVQRDAEEIVEIDGLTIGRSSNYLGGLIGSATNTFDGDIDEIRVWNRVLTEDEVQISYRTGRERLLLDIRQGADKDWKVIGANAADEQIVYPGSGN